MRGACGLAKQAMAVAQWRIGYWSSKCFSFYCSIQSDGRRYSVGGVTETH